MATNGEKFLALTRAKHFVLSGHALDRIEQYTGLRPTAALAHMLFRRSQYHRAEDLMLFGYRPAYARRVQRGVRSWYFVFSLFGQELVAVVSKGTRLDEFVWVTTYAPNAQTLHYRLAAPATTQAA